jgi:hypothetical protein
MYAIRRGGAEPAIAVGLGVTAAAFALSNSVTVRCGIAGLTCLFPLLQWVLSRAHRWIIVFFAAAILLPPLPFAMGDSGLHPALLFAAIGVLAGILAMPHWRRIHGPLPLLFMLFTVALLGSVCLAAIYSGSSIALGSLARVLLFAIGPYVFLYSLSIPNSPGDDRMQALRHLFRFATLAALFACVDFHFQLPTPARYEPQYIWLGELGEFVIRRAQGLFYEASTLGNFCAFFLVMILAAVTGRRANRITSLWELGFAGIAFTVALVFSYSRASLLNVLCAGILMLCIQRANLRWIFIPVVCVMAAAISIYLFFPMFAESYWLRVEHSVFNLSGTPADVLSGRIANWMALRDFIMQQPWHLILGIGYKTLPYSEFTGRQIIADNTYLDLLVETGVVGLFLFIALNIFILRAGIRAVRSPNPKAKFLGRWITCFWVGELVQMFSGDLITYWRVLPIYFWILAAAIRETNAEGAVES